MAKHLKLNIKNTQIAQAVNIQGIKGKLSKKKEAAKDGATGKADDKLEKKDEPIKIKARSRSAFADGQIPQAETLHPELFAQEADQAATQDAEETSAAEFESLSQRRESPFKLEEEEERVPHVSPEALRAKLFKDIEPEETKTIVEPLPQPIKEEAAPKVERSFPPREAAKEKEPVAKEFIPIREAREKLGPTGKHIKDLIPPKPSRPPQQFTPHHARGERPPYRGGRPDQRPPYQGGRPDTRPPYQGGRSDTRPPYQGRPGFPPRGPRTPPPTPPPASREEERQRLKHMSKPETAETEAKKSVKAPGKFREFKDLKPAKRSESPRFDARDRQGLTAGEDEGWRNKKRNKAAYKPIEEVTIRPTSLKVRLPISIKDLAEKMKLKASQLIEKLFLQGVIVTLNDQLIDETTIQLLGQEFGCEITIDTSEAERIRITDKSIKEEIKETDPNLMTLRPPVVAFMGHVDHGKTSLIDAIRSSNRAAGEAGAITQHMGAFRCETPVGAITILDTPGHEAFSAMRARGADVTDIVVLVVAGDEGMKQQTIEALQHAKAAKVTIVVAINKSDKPNFNAENVYRQLSEHELLPESWGGQTITVNCSAVTKQGVPQLLEMLALQAEVLELNANPAARARGTVIESEMHKGMGAVATVLVQNGTLKLGDAIVFGQHFGRVKTMRDEFGSLLTEATPSTPVAITGLSGLPEAGQEFIAVKSEKEAREISEVRAMDLKQTQQVKKRATMDSLLQQASTTSKKILNLVLRADVQGSLEALKTAVLKIESEKVESNIIFAGVGEISESDIQLAAASKAVIIGFHTQLEGHSDSLVKQLGVEVRLHDIIYHAVDDVKLLMGGLLDKIPQETEKGKAQVKATFKSSHHGVIAGCQVIEGSIARNNMIRVIRGKEMIWKGTISSLKRVKEDVKEVAKGLECGILLTNFNDAQEGDILEAYEITYLTQEL